MAAVETGADSDAGTIIEIKGGSLVSFGTSVPNIVQDDFGVASHDGPDPGSPLSWRSSLWKPSGSPSRTPSSVADLKSSKSRVTIATTSRTAIYRERSSESGDSWQPRSEETPRRQVLRQRSIHSLGTAVGLGEVGVGGPVEDGAVGARPGPCGDSKEGAPDNDTDTGCRPLILPNEKIPEGMAKLLRDIPEPRDLAHLVRSVVISADKPSKHVLHFKSTTKVRLGRQKKDVGPVLFEPTYWLEPKDVPSWRRIQGHMKDILAMGLKDMRYSEYLAENGCRILAAAIVQRLKKLNMERYRLAAKVRIAPRLNQGMSMYISCLWDAKVDRFADVQFENSTLAAQAILFLVYTD